jgi:AraC-like DNA-binding protein
MRLLDSQPNLRWTLRELADQLHLSPSYLLRLFKSSTSMPPMAYLARRRVETAAGLLLDTTQPVTQIGRSVGWPDQSYFARRFKAHFGLSPSTYRSRFAPNAGPLQAVPDADQLAPEPLSRRPWAEPVREHGQGQVGPGESGPVEVAVRRPGLAVQPDRHPGLGERAREGLS